MDEIGTTLAYGFSADCPECGRSARSTGRISRVGPDVFDWAIEHLCDGGCARFRVLPSAGLLPYVQSLVHRMVDREAGTESWRDEARSIRDSLSYLKTLSLWLERHRADAMSALDSAKALNDQAGLTIDFVRVRKCQVVAAIVSGYSHRVRFDSTGRSSAETNLRKMPVDTAGQCAVFLSARDCITMDFLASGDTYRCFIPSYVEFLDLFAAHVSRCPELISDVLRLTLSRIAESLLDLKVIPKANPALERLVSL